MRKTIAATVLLLILTACSSDPQPVQLTFEARDSTVVVRKGGASSETFNWVGLLEALVPLAALGVAWYGLQVSRKQAAIPIRVVVIEKQIELAAQASEALMRLAREYLLLAHGRHDLIRLAANLETTRNAIVNLTDLSIKARLVLPVGLFEALERAMITGKTMHAAFDPDKLGEKSKEELDTEIFQLRAQIEEFANTCRKEFRLERISQGTSNLFDTEKSS